MRTYSRENAERYHSVWCAGCEEYRSHLAANAVCRGNCGLSVHDDPLCPLVGKLIQAEAIGETHIHTVDCYGC